MNDQKPFIALTPALSSAVKKFMNKLGIMPVFKSEYCSYFIGNSCRFLVNKCSYLHDFFFGLWSFDQMSVIAVKPCWSQMKIFFMFSRLFTFDILLQKNDWLISNNFYLHKSVSSTFVVIAFHHTVNAFVNAISMSIIYLLTKSPDEMLGTPKDISRLI